MKSIVKKELMYSLIIPYVSIGIVAIVLFGGIQINIFSNMKDRILNKKIEMVKSLTKEMEYSISNIQRVGVNLENNTALWKLRDITNSMDATDKYNIAINIMKLKKEDIYDPFIKQVYVYYEKGDFITSVGNYYQNNIAYEKFHNTKEITYDQWYKEITRAYPTQELKRIGKELCYIVTTSPIDENNRANIIILLDENRLAELVEGYNDVEEKFYIKNNNNEIVFTNDSHIGQYDWNEEVKVLKKKYLYKDEQGLQCFQVKINGEKVIVLQNTIKRLNMEYRVIIPESTFMYDVRNSVLIFVSAIICFVLLLGSGIYIIYRKYKIIDSLIQRLKATYSFEEFENETYSEMEYIENILNNLKGAIKAQKGLVVEGVLRKSLQGILEADEEVYTYLECNGENFSSNYFITAIIEERSWLQETKNNRLNEFIINNTIEETFKDIAKTYTVTLNNNYIVVMSAQQSISAEKLEEIIECLETLRMYWEEKFGFRSIISLSRPYVGLSNTFFAYKEAKKSIEFKVFFDKYEITYPKELEKINNDYIYDTQTEIQLMNYIKLGRREEAIEIINNLIYTNIQENNLLVDGVKDLIREIEVTLDKVSKEIRYDIKLISGEYFLTCKTLTEIIEKINEIVNKMCIQVESQKKGINKVERIITYIHENYQDPNLNVSSIADTFTMNASYLSRLFKEQTGENLLSFINKYRVEKIKTLLLQTNLTLDEIGKRVGFISSVAVIRAFKKYEGITPSGYKDIHLN